MAVLESSGNYAPKPRKNCVRALVAIVADSWLSLILAIYLVAVFDWFLESRLSVRELSGEKCGCHGLEYPGKNMTRLGEN